ncbi:J domain-containing protein [Dyadobacter sp. CY343]|uniref:J domain-containing protein n=1 Tax=Dyadobacter sp. CY343 TaxID=2907299 RepID=UPI001F3C935A|nr:J domain-containing protein [Dyadobacter sp. CY343]MCE7060810.1 J domain-containing protein [Dyadobacter sp. CY343]
MARRNLYIPEEVKLSIREHLSERCDLALDGFISASEEEDTLTGDLGASLRIKNQHVFVERSIAEIPGTWTWGINYVKFRGRGPGATENVLGADGLFELSLKVGNRIEKKSILFQSKIDWRDDPNLLKQAIKLTTWREAAFILNFTASKFEAIDLDSVIASRGKRSASIRSTNLDEYIGSNFLDCIVGDVDLGYDATSRKLIWRAKNGETVAIKFSIPQRIKIQISAPNRIHGNNLNYNKEIGVDEIHNYRMDASEEEILSLSEGYSAKDIRKALATQALAYHPDKQSFSDALTENLMKRRMQEINEANELLKIKIKRNNR